MENEERKRWLIAAVVAVLFLAGLAFFIALALQTRVMEITGPALYRIREDMTGEQIGEFVSMIFPLGLVVVMLLVGGQMMTQAEQRLMGFLLWACALGGFYAVLTSIRDKLTLSEVQIRPEVQSVTCAGFLLGKPYWSTPALLSQVSSIEFPPLAQSPRRYGLVVRVAQAEFCSLHNRTLAQEEAVALAARLKPHLGDRVKSP